MNNIIQLNGIKAIIIREFIVFKREKERIISSIISPLLFLFVLGKSLNQYTSINGYDYQKFILSGIISMNILFTSMRYGLYLIWDKRFDFLKEVLVSPISRTSLFLGKAIGGVINSLIEMLIIIIISQLFIMKFSLLQLALMLITGFISSFMIVSIGLAIGGATKTMEGFGLVMNLLTWPMFLFSNALFEIKSTTHFIKIISLLNPFTYTVDLFRKITINYSNFSPFTSTIILILWSVIISFITIRIFEKIDISQ